MNNEDVEQTVVAYTSMPIALRFSRLTLKDMLMEEVEKEENIIKMWAQLGKISDKLYNNPKVVFLHKLTDDFWEFIDHDLAKSMIEFLIILVSQNETRTFVKYLIKDSLFIKRIKKTKIYDDSVIIKRLIESLESYLFENEEAAYSRLTLLKKLAFKYFPEELAKSSYNQQNESGSLVGKLYIQKAMENVSYDIISEIAKSLRINTLKLESLFADDKTRKDLLIELICDKVDCKNNVSSLSGGTYQNILSGDSVENTPSLINEQEFEDEENILIPIILNYNSLDIMDYMYRLFHASRKDLVKSIRKQVDYLNNNIGPQFDLDGKFDGFEGWNKDAAPVNFCNILTIKPSKLGCDYPNEIIAEAEFDLSAFSSAVQEMWLSLRSGEILVFGSYSNSKHGIKFNKLRCGEIQSIVYSSQNPEKRKEERQSYLLDQKLRVYINFDPVQFKNDHQESVNGEFNIDDIYQKFQIAMRMQRQDSALKHALDKIKDICRQKRGRNQFESDDSFHNMYNLKFDNPDDEEYLHIDNSIPYHTLFSTEEEFCSKFSQNP